jgi:hypothetical protein
MITFIGSDILQCAIGATHIATVFPKAGVVVCLPGIHATQRAAYLDALDAQRQQQNLPPLTEAEREAILGMSVDLIVKEGKILIRPDPSRMELAFEADTLLQEKVSKRQIHFLFVSDPRVRDAICRRGEAWRIYALPRSPEQIKKLIANARISAGGRAIYYYNALYGTRMLTCQEFMKLGELPDEELRPHLAEIAALARQRNIRGHPEVQPFMIQGNFNMADMAQTPWLELSPLDLRQRFAQWSARYLAAVASGFERDDIEDMPWRNHMYAALVGHEDDQLSEADLLGLGAEYFMQIEWLPGARIDNGEIIFDSVADERSPTGEATPCDMVVHGLICNLMQEQNDLEFINIGRVISSLSKRTALSGRREVYVEHFRIAGAAQDTLQIIRMQKWGVREHLDEGKNLLQAMVESEEYTDYIMDRRLGCRQLGMRLSTRVWVRKVAERYDGRQRTAVGTTIWSTYFQREYLRGLASDKIPSSKLKDRRYAVALARCLGEAAAPNMIVGRYDAKGMVIFDDGDEVVVEDEDGLPVTMVVADHTATFGDYRGELMRAAPAYADAINRRAALVPNLEEFTQAFLDGFLTRFRQILADYRARPRAFDALFRNRRCDPAGNLAFRWKLVLARLNRADPEELAAEIRKNVKKP